MKRRHQPIRAYRRPAGKTDAEPPGSASKTGGKVSALKNIELQQTQRGQYLVFKTSDGATFALNLDVQEEFGFEAKMMLEQWAREQGLEQVS